MAAVNISRLKFLVVEDDRHMSSLIAKVLRELGVEDLVEVGDGTEALRTMQVYTPDVIVTDWRMAPMDGIEFVRLVRKGEGGANPFVAIIMLTVHTERHRVRVARDAGVNEFVAKPVSVRTLYARIRQVIEHPRPFVRTDRYFGPDRRRKQMPFKGANQRTVMPWAQTVETPELGKYRSVTPIVPDTKKRS